MSHYPFGKEETQRLFYRELSLKVSTSEKGQVYILTCKKTGRSAALTSKEFCTPSVLKVKVFEISDHMVVCSGAELAEFANRLLAHASA